MNECMNLFRFITTNAISNVESESRIANESPKTFFQAFPGFPGLIFFIIHLSGVLYQILSRVT